MLNDPASRPEAPESHPPPPELMEEFEVLVETRTPSLVRRLLTTYRHALGLMSGGLVAYLRALPPPRRHGLRYRWLRLINGVTRHFVDRSLRDLPFPVQLRKRLETLGPTYIKLGQVMAMRRDLLPDRVTAELANLLDRLPAVPYKRFLELVERDLGRDPFEIFAYIEAKPHGLGLDRPGPPRRNARRPGGDPQGGQAGDPRDPQARPRPAADAGPPAPAGDPALPAQAGDRRVLLLHDARARPRARGRQRRDLRRQLLRPAGHRLPQDLPPVQRSDGAVHGVPARGQAEQRRGAVALRGRPRSPRRPRGAGDHPHALSRRLLPRRPAPREPPRSCRAAARVHRPRHGRPLRGGAAAQPALLLLQPGRRRRRERRALPHQHRQSRPRRRPPGLPARRRRRLPPLAAPGEQAGHLGRPADPRVGGQGVRATRCTSPSSSS